MHKFDLDAFRTTLETGGVLSVSLVAQGGSFHVQAETRRGTVALTKARSTTLREFRDLQRATLLLRELGVREFGVNTKKWEPEQADIGRPTRPDRALALHQALEAADIKRSLDAAIKQADDPATVWVGHDDLFDLLEAGLAG